MYFAIRNHSESSSTGCWKALAGGCNILVLAARRRVAGPNLFDAFGTTGSFDDPRPALPSLLTRGIYEKKTDYK